jgi:hypothetical protein
LFWCFQFCSAVDSRAGPSGLHSAAGGLLGSWAWLVTTREWQLQIGQRLNMMYISEIDSSPHQAFWLIYVFAFSVCLNQAHKLQLIIFTNVTV